MIFFFFFFKQKTAYEMRISDWSSDVCSSDLRDRHLLIRCNQFDPPCIMLGNRRANDKLNLMEQHQRQNDQADLGRSEQRARYGNPARQTLFRSAKDQNRFVLGGKSSKPEIGRAHV